MKKILVLSALYPPYAFGGAEDCAHSFAGWAVGEGHQVRVLMAARSPNEDGHERNDEGVTVDMLATPHLYPVSLFDQAHAWQKPIWHLQDHLANGAGSAIAQEVAKFMPDAVVIHYLQGFGYRTLAWLARCGVPVIYVLHDLGLACIRMSMFRDGRQCAGQCLDCRVSRTYKTYMVRRLAARTPVGFIAPSRAIIDVLDRYFPVKRYPHARILNTKAYPGSDRRYQTSSMLRLLYAGKLDQPKGIAVLLAAVSTVAQTRRIHLTVAGAGPLEQELRTRYAAAPWLSFIGFVSQQALADEMATADLLCVPSLWQENSPGVVIQALGAGLPIAATDRGGLSELVEDGLNGVLLRRHDVADWVEQLEKIAADPALVAGWRARAEMERQRFEIDAIGRQTIAFIDHVGSNAS